MDVFTPTPKQTVTLTQPTLELCNVNKRYKGGVWANRNISFRTQPGEIIGILGPNAAGKTTLIRQITTELLPTSGTIKILGHDVISRPTLVKTLLGIVPQEAKLFEYLTVYQHLRIFGKLRGLSPKDAGKRANEVIGELHMTEQRNSPVKNISGGMGRRLLIGIAILANPSILVLDDPTTGLDPQSRRDLWDLLKAYRDKGTTVLLTTPLHGRGRIFM